MKSHRKVLVLLISLAAAACAEAPTAAVAPDAEPRLAVGPACVEFGPPPALGTVYGSPVGTIPQTNVFAQSGINVFTDRFRLGGGMTAYGMMRIENAFGGFGFGQIARANNINIGFDFSGVGFQVNTVKFEWRDQGGFENLIVNGGAFIGELDTPPPGLGGVAIASASFAFPGGDQGTTTLTAVSAPVQWFQVGGQELWIDRVCAWP